MVEGQIIETLVWTTIFKEENLYKLLFSIFSELSWNNVQENYNFRFFEKLFQIEFSSSVNEKLNLNHSNFEEMEFLAIF